MLSDEEVESGEDRPMMKKSQNNNNFTYSI